jgi:hypothetical protein
MQANMCASDATVEVNAVIKRSERSGRAPKEPGPSVRVQGKLHYRQRAFFRFRRSPDDLAASAVASTSRRILGGRSGVHKKQGKPFTRIECATRRLFRTSPLIHWSKMRDLPLAINPPSSDQQTRLANEYSPPCRMVGIRVLLQNRIPPAQSKIRDIEGRKAQSLKPDLRETPQSHLRTHRKVPEC